jgi:hypothetical protein
VHRIGYLWGFEIYLPLDFEHQTRHSLDSVHSSTEADASEVGLGLDLGSGARLVHKEL